MSILECVTRTTRTTKTTTTTTTTFQLIDRDARGEKRNSTVCPLLAWTNKNKSHFANKKKKITLLVFNTVL